MIHSSKFYTAQYKKYKEIYAKYHKVYGKNMAKKYKEELFVKRMKQGYITNLTAEARGAIYTSRKQGTNLVNRFKEGIRLAKANKANGEKLTEIGQKLADLNIHDVNAKDIRALTGDMGELIDALNSADDSYEAWKEAVGSI